MAEIMINGYRRKNGFGVRNYVLIISTVQCVNTAAAQIAAATGAIPITHDFGCEEGAEGKKYTFQSLLETAKHPNVYGGVIIGLGCEQCKGYEMVEQLKDTGKPFTYLEVQQEGGPAPTVAHGKEIAAQLVKEAAAQPREKFPISELIVAVQCGGSDWTTALTGNVAVGTAAEHLTAAGASVIISEVGGLPGSEHLLARQAVTKEVGLKIIDMTDARRDYFFKKNGKTLTEANPTPGNKDGGITTLVEKSTGNIKKIGKCPIKGVLGLYEKPVEKGAAYCLDHRCPGVDSSNTTAFALSGAQVELFSTGRGTPLGNALMPLIKLTGNPESYRQLPSMLDFNAGVVIEGESMEKVGKELYELVIEVANGKQTKNEEIGNHEYFMLHPAY